MATVLQKQWDSDCITVDEMREMYERQPIGDGLGSLTKTAYIAAITTAAAQQEIALDHALEPEPPQPKVVRAAHEDAEEDKFLRKLVRQCYEERAVAT